MIGEKYATDDHKEIWVKTGELTKIRKRLDEEGWSDKYVKDNNIEVNVKDIELLTKTRD